MRSNSTVTLSVGWLLVGVLSLASSASAGCSPTEKARVDNAGVLTASGLIAGEALCGLVIAGLVGTGHDVALFKWTSPLIVAIIVLAVLIIAMVQVPLANAGRPEDPAPPTAIM